MTDKKHISCRVPVKVREELDKIARKRRMETGEDVRLADLIRDALEEYVERHKA